MKKEIQLDKQYKFLNPLVDDWCIGTVYQLYANNIVGILYDDKQYGVHTSALRDIDEEN